MSRYTVCRTIAYLLAASALFILLALTSFALYPPNTQHLPAIYNNQDFGIGFDLALSYGTVAVSYWNESISSIAKIEGDVAYKEMMYRLSLDSSKTSQCVLLLSSKSFLI